MFLYATLLCVMDNFRLPCKLPQHVNLRYVTSVCMLLCADGFIARVQQFAWSRWVKWEIIGA